MKKCLIILFLMVLCSKNSDIFAQNYSLNNCHSHNDYLQKNPFHEAFDLGFGSIEADVFLVNNELYVAHEKTKIDSTKTLKKLYLEPLLVEIGKNNWKLKQPLQLLIDLKTGGETLKILEKQVISYKAIFKKAKVNIVVSGEMPSPAEFANYDEIISFDGRENIEYTKAEAKRLALISGSMLDIVKWNGKGQLGDDQLEKLEQFVKKVHKKGKKLRLWATPDTPTAWTTLMNLKIDWIGTDNLKGLSKFLE